MPKQQRTAKFRLDINPNLLKPTVNSYTNAFNYCCQYIWDNDTELSNRKTLHKETYYVLKENFGLTSQLTISVISKSLESMKSIRALQEIGQEVSCPKSKQQSIRYDCNSYTLNLKKQEVSLSTTKGRIKCNFYCPKYFEKYLDWTYSSAELVIENNQVHLHVVFSKNLPTPKSNNEFVGIDRGVKKLAATTQNKFYGGGKIKQRSDRYIKLRSDLRKKKTRSARRHLIKMRHKEQRFRRDIIHQVSKSIISSLKPGTTIVLEDLTGIRDRCKQRKEQRVEFHRWNFDLLQKFLVYKGLPYGIRVEYVDPAYTSKMCSRCGHICDSNRTKQAIFCCKKCGFRINADLNGSRNIRNKSETLDAISDGLKSTSLMLPLIGSSKPLPFRVAGS